MEFEFDAEKSTANEAKHGIDFDDAQALWDDPWSLEAPAATGRRARASWVIAGSRWPLVGDCCTRGATRTSSGRPQRILGSPRPRKKGEIERYEGTEFAGLSMPRRM